jgi:S1-C subfamily serine protease
MSIWSRVRPLALVALASGLASCAANLGVYRYDNPDIRRRQGEQLDQTLPDTAERQRMLRLIGPRVAFLVSGEAGAAFDPQQVLAPSGRAACIAPDGYYLTALHVIGKDPFYLLNTTLRPGEKAGAYSFDEMARHYHSEVHEGRVVWKDAALDLAILKFDRSTPDYFAQWRAGAPAGTMLHAADDWGRGVLRLNGTSTDSASLIGNGAFQAAGVVSHSGRRKRGKGGLLIESEMVSRGGMSGAPLVTPAGEMAGIIIQVEINPLMKNRSQTLGIMIAPERIAAILETDRLAQVGRR